MASTTRISLGMQCFWGAEALFGALSGVRTTRVGYAGGTSANPTYRNISDHIEIVDIEFDPSKLPLEDLLEIFFKSHDSTVRYKRQYISAILYYDDLQKTTISNVITKQQAKLTKKIVTEVAPIQKFTNAEDYHQKFFLRKYKPILKELNLSDNQIITSPVATRLNGFCAGFGTVAQLEQENFSLSPSVLEMVKRLIQQGPNLHECGI